MSYIGRQNLGGAYRQLDDISSGFDGSDTTHTMQVNSQNVTVGDVNQIILSLGGVIQKPGTDFTVSGSVLTFTTAPAANTSFFAILLGSDNGGTVTPTDGSVTTAKIAADQITKAKLADEVDIFAGTSLNAADLGTGIHIKTADSSAATHTSADELVLENSGHCGISINSGTASTGNIYWNDSGGTARGYIQYNHDGDEIAIGNAGATSINITSDGEVTMAKQPAFSVTSNAVQSNIGDNTTLAFGSETFDIGNNFASDTTFTAPVTGKYQLNANVRIDNLDLDGAYHALTINTSNRAYYALHGSAHWDADAQYYFFSFSILADMDANDTAYLLYNENSSQTDQADVSTSSYFMGYLAC